MDNSLSIFIPFYNDAGTVEYMISAAYHFGSSLTADLEVIAINDGSVDHTLEELKRMQDKYPYLIIIEHNENKGYGGALIAGINRTTKSWVFYTDGDAQYHLDELKGLWKVRNGKDIVNGYKLSRSDNKFRQMVGVAYSWLLKQIFKTPITDIDCDYRLIKGDLLRTLNLTYTSGAITIELIKKLQLKNAKFIEMGVHHYKRMYGQSAFFTPPNIFKTFIDEYKLLKELKNEHKIDV
jgi:glycosyltransferase involved in cell wall biosynthesis